MLDTLLYYIIWRRRKEEEYDDWNYSEDDFEEYEVDDNDRKNPLWFLR